MSGFAGLLDFNAKPIDVRVLKRLADALKFRGPDALQIWRSGPVGLAHSLLRTTVESRHERQPCSLDAGSWIVADARIDARGDLRHRLQSSGHDCPRQVTDAQLILHAYRAWGEACVEHLLGDFSFAIWDASQEKLFCARDHLGVKPFFYAGAAGGLVFSNTLSCIREHPAVSGGLNEDAIADFLLFGANQDPSATAFAGVHRLAPAHRLTVSAGTLRAQRYWELPAGDSRARRSADDYVDGFLEQLNLAVADRMRCQRVGVLMSGGLDSTSIAASAKALLVKQRKSFDLRAYTCAYDSLIPDEERGFATLAADALAIPQHYLVADGYGLFERWRDGGLRLPEPADEPLAALYLDQTVQIAANSRVALTGWDGDALMSEDSAPRRGRFRQGVEAIRRVAANGWPGLFLRQCSRRIARGVLARPGRTASAPGALPLPEWLDSALVARLELRQRWRTVPVAAASRGGEHERARRTLTSPLFTGLLERYDPGVTRIPVEMRHPLLDLRVVNYILSLPVSPWCQDKTLLRCAMRGRLPEAIRLRPKTPLADDPVCALLQRVDGCWVDALEAAPRLERFVDREAIPALAGNTDPEQIWTALRALCLNLWLRHLDTPQSPTRREEIHEVA